MKSNKMNRIFYSVILLAIAGFLLASCKSSNGEKQAKQAFYYTCSMHSQVHEDKPGDCPICGMKLIKVVANAINDTTLTDTSLAYLTKPVTQSVVGDFKVITPIKKQLKDTLIADGIIGFDKRDLNSVSSRVAGRIEKLYVRYTGQSITKGQPLIKIYSPQLLSVQRDLLQTIKDKNEQLSTSLKASLLNLGMNENEIEKVIKTKSPIADITTYSPYSGIAQMPENQASMGNSSELLNIKEGMYVQSGQNIFSIQNINRSWAMLNILNSDVTGIHVGDQVNLYADADKTKRINGQIDFIPPNRMGDNQTTSVRVYLNHIPKDWKIGTLIHGNIVLKNKVANYYVPLSAVNRLGDQAVVWVQDDMHKNLFHVRKVTTGLRTEDSIEIISGINDGDKIAENAAYMVDSDSFIQ